MPRPLKITFLIVGGLFGLFIVFGIVGAVTMEPGPSAVERAVKKSAPTTSTIATTTTTTTTTARALTVQEVFEGCADPWDGNLNGLEALIRAVLNDPGSMETHGTYYFTTDDLDDGLVTIKLDYGARNSFGGMVRTSAWAEMRPDCEIAEVIDYGFYGPIATTVADPPSTLYRG